VIRRVLIIATAVPGPAPVNWQLIYASFRNAKPQGSGWTLWRRPIPEKDIDF